MFLPLLQLINDPQNPVSPNQMGDLDYILVFFSTLNVELSLFNVLVFLSSFFVAKGLVQFTGESYKVVVRKYFTIKSRVGIIHNLNQIGYKKFVLSDVGRIQNTMTTEISRVVKAYETYFKTLEQVILVSVYLTFAFYANAQFTLLVTIGGLLTNILYSRVYKLTKTASVLLTKHSHRFQGLVIQHVGNFKYLKATGSLKKYEHKIKRTILETESVNKRIGLYNAFLFSAREPLLILIIASVILIQGKIMGNSLGPVIISLIFLYRALSALLVVQSSWNSFLGLSGSVKNLQDFEKELKSSVEHHGEVNFDHFKNSIRLRDVNFHYQKDQILYDVNLEIKQNETVAFVGHSGSGKTTLVNIIAGLMPVEQGVVEIDGIDRNRIDIPKYQMRIGYITQDPVIFNDTLLNNITFWQADSKASRSRFEEATQKAAINNFINSLPKKEQTVLGNNGINLSGGQKQRVSMARELYKDIDILIMDEATSALDSETERLIHDNISQLKGNYTILVVAHRLSTIKNADRIVFMNQGRIQAIGSFEELINNVSEFKAMAALQGL